MQLSSADAGAVRVANLMLCHAPIRTRPLVAYVVLTAKFDKRALEDELAALLGQLTSDVTARGRVHCFQVRRPPAAPDRVAV